MNNGKIAALLTSWFGDNYKTTLMGYAGSVAIVAGDVCDAYQAGSFGGKHGIGIVAALILAAFGRVSSDAKKPNP